MPAVVHLPGDLVTAVLSAAPRHELRVRAMGTEGHIVVIGGPVDGTVWAAERIEQLEARWSRFRPDSEVSRINASPDEAVPVIGSRKVSGAGSPDFSGGLTGPSPTL